MKKQNNFLHNLSLTLLFLIATTSCEKAFKEALDRVADSRETLEGMLNDANKVRGMFEACYEGIPNNRMYLYFWTSEEELADNCFDAQGQSMDAWRSGSLTPTNCAVWAGSQGNAYSDPGAAAWWGRYWGAVRFCNIFIENFDKITVSQELLPQSERDLMLDEATALRAFYHFKLISMYGPLPFIDKSFTLDYAGWPDMKRPTYQDVASRIATELQKVIDSKRIPLKRDPLNVNDKYRMPLAFVYGLKSRVLLYNASPLNNPSGDKTKYDAAAAAAKQFLDLNAYTLEPYSNSKNMYISNYNVNVEAVEVVWRGRDRLNQLSNVAGMDGSLAVPKFCAYGIAKSGETPSQEIVDCYELKNGAMVIQNYDATHANPTFTPEAIAAKYDDVNNPYANRDARLSRDIIYNGSNSFGASYQMGNILVWTYLGAPGTGTNGNTTAGKATTTYTGYFFAKDRDPLWYGSGVVGGGNGRAYAYSIWMRLGEIYLNYAEALCGASRFEEAVVALDMTRVRAGQPPLKLVPDYKSGDLKWLMRRIQNERRVELLLEDSRFYDVRRWNLISDVNNNTVSIIVPTKVTATTFTYKRFQTPFVWACHNEKYKVLPIPLVDGKLLPGLTQPDAWK